MPVSRYPIFCVFQHASVRLFLSGLARRAWLQGFHSAPNVMEQDSSLPDSASVGDQIVDIRCNHHRKDLGHCSGQTSDSTTYAALPTCTQAALATCTQATS